MEYTAEIAAQCASIGAQLLDEYDPNWFEHIDIVDLQMSSTCSCIVGQLYGTASTDYAQVLTDKFEEGRWIALVGYLGLEHQDLYRLLHTEDEYPDKFLGFDIPYPHLDDPDEEYAFFRYQKLRHAWIVEIEKRRDERGRRTVPA